jgi:acyl-CoA thioester hydrolase
LDKEHGDAGRKLLLTTRIPVRWGDMDAYGHLNNTLYFRFFEQARVEWIEQLGFPVRSEAESGPVIIHADCTFLIPVNYPATAEVRLYAGRPGRSSLMTWYELYVEGDERMYASGSAKVVWMHVETGKSAPLPDSVRALFPD